MADARALLRQQRAARRIEHRFAAYSEGGRLLCTLCREPVKTESLWPAHLAGETHQQKLRVRAASADENLRNSRGGGSGGSGIDEFDDGVGEEEAGRINGGQKQDTLSSSSLKRKQSEATADDEPMEDDEHGVDGHGHGDVHGDVPDNDDEHGPQSVASKHRGKRTRSGLGRPMPSVDVASELDKDKDKGKGTDKDSLGRTLTPPSLEASRRASNTPSHGVEIQIPSRPATPRREGSSSSTPLTAGPSSSTPNTITSLPSRNASTALAAAVASAAGTAPTAATTTVAATPQQRAQVDDEEWAAFESEIAAVSYAPDAVISAPAMTAAESSAARDGDLDADGRDNDEARRARAEAGRQEEREEATRALEEEFAEMEELESRVRRLKEKREALRRRSSLRAEEARAAKDAARVALAGTASRRSGGSRSEVARTGESSNVFQGSAVVAIEDGGGGGEGAEAQGRDGKDNDGSDDSDVDGDDEGDTEDEDGWVGFRFRAA